MIFLMFLYPSPSTRPSFRLRSWIVTTTLTTFLTKIPWTYLDESSLFKIPWVKNTPSLDLWCFVCGSTLRTAEVGNIQFYWNSIQPPTSSLPLSPFKLSPPPPPSPPLLNCHLNFNTTTTLTSSTYNLKTYLFINIYFIRFSDQWMKKKLVLKPDGFMWELRYKNCIFWCWKQLNVIRNMPIVRQSSRSKNKQN